MSCFSVMSKSLICGQRIRVEADVVVSDAVTLHQDNSQSSPQTISCVVCTVFTWVQSQSFKCVQPLRDTLTSIAWLCTEAGEQGSHNFCCRFDFSDTNFLSCNSFSNSSCLETAAYIEDQVLAILLSVLLTAMPVDMNTDDNGWIC